MKKLFYLLSFLNTSLCLADQTWISIPDKSNIKFIASYDDSKFEGQFSVFSSQFILDSKDDNNNQLTSSIDVTSVNTRSRDRDQALAESDWFYFDKFPRAEFNSLSIEETNNESFNVKGLLSIRDQKKEISFPMQWIETSETQRRAQAQVKLDRRDYNIGIGEWLEDDTIGFDVEVIFDISYQLTE